MKSETNKNTYARKLKWFPLYANRKWTEFPISWWKISLIQLPLRLSPKLWQLFFRRSIILLLILCNARCIAAPWGSGLMNAFNKMLLHTWNIPVISGGRQRGKRRAATTHVAGNGTQKYEVACSQVRHCTRSRATFRLNPNVRKLSRTATGTTCYTNILSNSSTGYYCREKLLFFAC